MYKTTLALVLLIYGSAALADVIVKDAWVRGVVTGQTTTGAFMELTANEDVALVGISSPVAGVAELHKMSMDDGVMKMRALSRLELPAGKSVTLMPGGYHVMLMDLKRPVTKGETIPLVLQIEGKDKKRSALEVKAEVRELTAPPMMEHKHYSAVANIGNKRGFEE